MTAETVKVIITVEVAERKIDIGQMEIGIDEKLDEQIHQGLKGLGKALYGSIVQGVDEGLREVVPEEWKNVGREERQFMTSVGLIQFKRRIY